MSTSSRILRHVEVKLINPDDNTKGVAGASLSNEAVKRQKFVGLIKRVLNAYFDAARVISRVYKQV